MGHTKTFKKGFRGVWSDFGLTPGACKKKIGAGELQVADRDTFFGRNIYEVVKEFTVDLDPARR